jgi:pimeloyl-ACP methyl ester carboxylesterase
MVRRGTPGAPLRFVMVHGWTCDHGSMEPVAAAFPDADSTLVDLLGHGASPKAASYAIADQAAAALASTGGRAVWVGHSMGAQVALEAARQAPERVAGVALLDPAFIAPTDKALAFGQGMQTQLARVDIPAMIELFGRNQIVSATDSDAVETLVATMRATDPAVVRAAWDAILTWDGRAALAAMACPGLVIAIDKPLNRLPDLARLNARLMTGQVAGSGHMVQFEVMDQVAAMMRRMLALAGLLSAG